MNKKCKPVLGQPYLNSTVKNATKYFTDVEKHQIIEEYLNSNETKQTIWQRHTGQVREHGQILSWMRKLGYPEHLINSRPTFMYQSNFSMNKDKSNKEVERENLELKRKIALLEAKLYEETAKAFAFSTMIDIAEKELKIPIRKKSNTKP